MVELVPGARLTLRQAGSSSHDVRRGVTWKRESVRGMTGPSSRLPAAFLTIAQLRDALALLLARALLWVIPYNTGRNTG